MPDMFSTCDACKREALITVKAYARGESASLCAQCYRVFQKLRDAEPVKPQA